MLFGLFFVLETLEFFGEGELCLTRKVHIEYGFADWTDSFLFGWKGIKRGKGTYCMEVFSGFPTKSA